MTDWTRPLFDGGLGPGSGSAILKRTIELAAYAHGLDLDTPFEKLPVKTQSLILYGYPPVGAPGYKSDGDAPKAKADKGFRFQGVLKFLERNFEESSSDSYREWMTQYMPEADNLRAGERSFGRSCGERSRPCRERGGTGCVLP